MKNKLSVLFICFYFEFCLAQVFNGYTLFSPTQGGPGGNTFSSYLINNNFEAVNTWSHSRGAASMPYLMKDSTLYYPYRVQNPTMSTGGVGGGISKYNWDGELLWNYELSNDVYQHHHDIYPLENGNVLVIAWERHSEYQPDGSIYYGGVGAGWAEMGRVSVGNSLNQMWGTAILELEPVGENDVNIVWEWHIWDHLVQDVDPDLPNYGVVSEHPERMDINFGDAGANQGPGGANADWMHLNAIDYNAELDQIVISSRHHGEIYIIDHSTTTEEAAGHTGGNFGRGGDFLYRWGNPRAYDRGSTSDQKLFAPHGVNWIPGGYPGAGNLIIFNNNYSNSSSAVFEIVTPFNGESYVINEGQPYGPQGPFWMHTGGFHSQVQSGAFRMPNGNTLISDADDARLFEVDAENNIVWDYSFPGSQQIMIARAQKYPLDYLEDTFPSYIIGDINFDTHLNIFDLLYIVDMAFDFYITTPPADYNLDGEVSLSDVIIFAQFLLNY